MPAARSTQVRVRWGEARWLVPALASWLLACGGKAAEDNADVALQALAPARAAQAEVPPAVPGSMPAGSELSPPAGSVPPTSEDSASAAPRPLNTQAVLASGGAIVTWGHTGILYKDHPGNLRLLHNVLSDLTAGVPAARNGRLLYTSDCDPRQDSRHCRLADSSEELAGFFTTVADFGRLEFRLAQNVTLGDYAAVIFDTCLSRGGSLQLNAYLEHGGRALILGDNFCVSAGVPSAQVASVFLRGSGLDFTASDPGRAVTYEVPAELRTGLLAGVDSLDIFRVAPQRIEHGFVPVVRARSGVLMARLHAN